jgi:hypothetical protein
MTYPIDGVERHFVRRVDRRWIRSSPFADAVMERLEARYLFSHHAAAALPPPANLALPSQLPVGTASVSLFASAAGATPIASTAVSVVTPAAAPIGQAGNQAPTDVDSLLSVNSRDSLFGGLSEGQETFVVHA